VKVLIASSLLVSIQAWLLLIEVPKRQNQVVYNTVLSELGVIADVLAVSVKSALDREDFVLLQDIQQQFLVQDNYPVTALVLVDDESGEVVVARFPEDGDETMEEELAQLSEIQIPVAEVPFQFEGGSGRVVTLLDNAVYEARNADRLAPLYVSSSLILIISVILLAALRYRIIGPIVAASREASQMAAGHYLVAQQAPKGDGEIRYLQISLQTLAKSLINKDAEQKRLISELENKVLEVQKATAAERRSYEIKQRFMANVSHEVRTPLNAILGLASLLNSEQLTQLQSDRVLKIIKSGEHLLSIINDILNFNKLNAGTVELQNEEVDSDAFVSNLAAIVQPLATTKKIEFIVDLSEGFPETFIADNQRLSQVVLNLLSNALKFTREGHVSLVLTVNEIEGRRYLQFSVEDSGPGLTEADISAIFEEFHQLDNSSTREAGGTGLGLPISKRLVELMSGELTVKSEKGVGSCFTASIPFETSRFQPSKSPARIVRQKSDKRILVVDDNPVTAAITARYLSKAYNVVEMADSGAIALEKIYGADSVGSPYDVLVTDWLMPGIDGLKMVEFTEQSGLHKTLKVIFVTGSPDQLETTRWEKKSGLVDLILPKPVFGDQLLRAVDSVLSGKDLALETRLHTHTWVQQNQSFVKYEGVKVLLVEDNGLNQEVAIGYLSKFGVSVDVAVNGKEALDRLIDSPDGRYAICFMDVQMPVMDGLTATKEIRKIKRFDDLPIIAMTASAYPTDRIICMEAGMNDFLPKPLNINELSQKVSDWLEPSTDVQESKVVDSKPVSTDSAFADIDEIDEDAALALCGNDYNLFLKMCQRFVKDFPELRAQLDLPVDPENVDELSRATHTVKAVCGSIGASRLARLAQKINHLLVSDDQGDCAAGDSQPAELMPILIEDLDALVDVLSSAVDVIEAEECQDARV
jgi:signal transduction histidine kinase/CheY-like chemotaxis protein